MKTNRPRQPRICPFCGAEFRDMPALSRVDVESLICPDCGVREALTSIDMDEEEQEQVLNIMHRFQI